MNALDDLICVESIKKIMQVFGGKWTFLIMGELHTGPMRFNQLNRNLGCSTKSLTDALKSLEAEGVILRTVIPSSPVVIEYSLTEKGKDFEAVFHTMRQWGAKWLTEETVMTSDRQANKNTKSL
jgi:DNA-binding HxlR family transcriptional regulator